MPSDPFGKSNVIEKICQSSDDDTDKISKINYWLKLKFKM